MKRNSKNNVLASVNNSLNNLNNNVKKVVQNDLVINTLRVLLILYSSFVVPHMNARESNVVNNNVVRLIVVALIVYLGFVDMVTAVLLLIAFVVTMHHSNSTSSKNNVGLNLGPKEENFMNEINNLNNNNNAGNNMGNNEGNNMGNNEGNNGGNNEGNNEGNNGGNNMINNVNSVLDNNFNNSSEVVPNNLGNNNLNAGVEPTLNDSREVVGNQIETQVAPLNNQALVNEVVANNSAANNVLANNAANNQRENNKGEDVNAEIDRNNRNQPASETMTESILRAQGFTEDPNSPQGLITAQNLYDASENAVPGANVNDQLMTFQNQMGIQGMDDITGPNARRYDGYHYNNEEERPNLTSGMIKDRNVFSP